MMASEKQKQSGQREVNQRMINMPAGSSCVRGDGKKSECVCVCAT